MIHLEQERKLFISLVCVLLGFGVLMVHSASITSWPTKFEQFYLSRHTIFLTLGILAGIFCACVPARVWFHAAPMLFSATIVLLGAVLVPGLGTEVNGAQRWLRFGSVSMQPSELAKISLPLFLCCLVTRRREQLTGWFSGTIPMLLPIAVIVPLVGKQPDLGTALFLACVGLLTLFLAGWPIRNFVLGIALVIPTLTYFVAMKPYQLKRVTGFLNTWSDFEQSPYQLKQSLVTLGAGGISGVGLGRGWQKLSFLPEANTDFVIAVVGEELGLIGTFGLVLLWGAMYVAGLRLFRFFDRQSFAFIAGVTLLTQLVLQAALNVAVVTAMVPPKGIPHPLISYGGSSLVVSLVALGIVISLSRAKLETDDVVLT